MPDFTPSITPVSQASESTPTNSTVVPTFQKELEAVPLQVRSLWIQDHPDYLQSVIYHNVSYLGKSLGNLVEMHALELVEAHIYSILSQLVVDYPYKKDLLVLLTLPF